MPECDNDISLKLDRLERAIIDRILPLLEKHDNTIYGKDGNNGIVGGLRETRTKVSFLEKMLFIVATAAVGGLFTAIFSFISKRG